MVIFIPRSAVVGATVGVTPALIVLTMRKWGEQNGIHNCIRRGRDDGLVCIDSRALPHLGSKKILVPIDFSECSMKGLAYAKALATQFKSTLVLLKFGPL
jgi:hypothetical protein